MKLFRILFLIFAIAAPAWSQTIKQSTASTVNVKLTKISDGTDHTGLTVTGITLKIIKQTDTLASTVTSATCAASGSSNDCVEVAVGVYNVELSASNTDTLGRIVVCASASGDYTDCVERDVVAAASYAANISGDVATVPANFDDFAIDGTGRVTVGAIGTDVVTADAIATGAIGAAEIAAAAITSSEAPNLDVAVSTRGTNAVQRASGFQWVMQMVTAGGVAVTSGTPACTRSIDAPGTFSSTTNSPSALTANGLSELTLSSADMNGTDYVVLKCTVSSARDYYTIFKLQAP